MNNLILVRHGQSQWNKENKFTGWVDIDLTEKGRIEAAYAGELIKKLNINIDAFFTSELMRATNTMNIILKILKKSDKNVYKAWQLNERHYGSLTGLNKDEISKKYGKDQVKIWRRSFDTPPPIMDSSHPYMEKINSKIVSESLKNTYDRVIPFYNEKIKPLIDSNKNILIVFHGNSCRALLMKIFNISKEKIVDLELPTGNPLLVNIGDGDIVSGYKYLDSNRSKEILFDI
jgi:2,3-bisphosphoglycerate-dependent phosphoglycerate mutase